MSSNNNLSTSNNPHNSKSSSSNLNLRQSMSSSSQSFKQLAWVDPRLVWVEDLVEYQEVQLDLLLKVLGKEPLNYSKNSKKPIPANSATWMQTSVETVGLHSQSTLEEAALNQLLRTPPSKVKSLQKHPTRMIPLPLLKSLILPQRFTIPPLDRRNQQVPSHSQKVPADLGLSTLKKLAKRFLVFRTLNLITASPVFVHLFT